MQDIDLNTSGDDGGGGRSVVLHSLESGTSHHAAELRKLSPSKYKGVVPQPNGRWGAQIYEKHHRVWLGTSQDELQHSSTLAFNYPLHPVGRRLPSLPMARELLFEKKVTPSDVGKLNRLVIPKHHAEKHFPLKITNEPVGSTANRYHSVLLNVEDVGGKVWRFRYSYWSSSQSYVLTKGWSRFAKEKNLSAGDVICFLRSVEGGKDGNKLYIDWKRGNNVRDGGFYPYVLPVPATVRLFGVNIAMDDVGGLD